MSSIRVWMHVHIPLLKLEPTLPELFPEMHLKKGATFSTFACYSWIRRSWAPQKKNLLIISPTEENPTNRRKRGNVVWEIILSDCLFHRCNKSKARRRQVICRGEKRMHFATLEHFTYCYSVHCGIDIAWVIRLCSPPSKNGLICRSKLLVLGADILGFCC